MLYTLKTKIVNNNANKIKNYCGTKICAVYKIVKLMVFKQ